MTDQFNNQDPENYQTPEEAYTKSQKAPAVAAKPGKNFIFLGLFILIVVMILYFVFSGFSKDEDEASDRKVFFRHYHQRRLHRHQKLKKS